MAVVGAVKWVGGWAVLRVYSLPQLLPQPSPSVLFGLGLTIGIFHRGTPHTELSELLLDMHRLPNGF